MIVLKIFHETNERNNKLKILRANYNTQTRAFNILRLQTIEKENSIFIKFITRFI